MHYVRLGRSTHAIYSLIVIGDPAKFGMVEAQIYGL